MSRSKKKLAGGGITTASSEKDDKKIWHKIFRRKNKALVKHDGKDTEIIYPIEKEVSDPWLMDKDGKGICHIEKEAEEKIRRK